MMTDMRKHLAHFTPSLLLSFAGAASFAEGASAFVFVSSAAFFWAD